MDRQSRTLHHKKQDGIKIQSVPPSIVEGQEGDMVFFGGFLYVKANRQWHQFLSVNKSYDTIELPEIPASTTPTVADTTFVTILRDKVNEIIKLFKLQSGDV